MTRRTGPALRQALATRIRTQSRDDWAAALRHGCLRRAGPVDRSGGGVIHKPCPAGPLAAMARTSAAAVPHARGAASGRQLSVDEALDLWQGAVNPVDFTRRIRDIIAATGRRLCLLPVRYFEPHPYPRVRCPKAGLTHQHLLRGAKGRGRTRKDGMFAVLKTGGKAIPGSGR